MADKKDGAGILVFRKVGGQVEVFLVHPGGPFWVRKDAWGIPKGESKDHEDLKAVATREFEEEVGQPVPAGEWLELGEVKRSDGRLIKAWAVEGDINAQTIKSNMTEIEWPPKSGQMIKIPEVDKAEWMSLAKALKKIHAYQKPLLKVLADQLHQPLEMPPEAEQSALF